MLKFLRSSPKKLFPEAKHVVEFAFTIGGKDYYKFTDLLNAPYERALKALVFYREVDLNIDTDFLQKHCDAVDTVLDGERIDIYKIKALNALLKQRLTLPKHPELMWKLASVVYFDKAESPEVYDFEYNKGKIEFWKKHADLRSFFLSKPVVELIPYLKYAEENLEMFSQIIEEHHNQHSEKVLEIISGKQKMN
jgi:hypothetical protein